LASNFSGTAQLPEQRPELELQHQARSNALTSIPSSQDYIRIFPLFVVAPTAGDEVGVIVESIGVPTKHPKILTQLHVIILMSIIYTRHSVLHLE
jgi:hypothetical protein